MKDYIRERVIEEADYIIKTKATIRRTAKKFCISKSCVNVDLKKLYEANPQKYYLVREVIDENKATRYIRGGMATKMKYARQKGLIS